MIVVRIALSDWETFGTASLEGKIFQAAEREGLALSECGEVVLEIEQTSLSWRQAHGGPEVLLVPEYVPMCLIDSVAHLCAKGVLLKIVEVPPSHKFEVR